MNFIYIITFLGFIETLILFISALRAYIFTIIAIISRRRKSKSNPHKEDVDPVINNYFVSVLLPIYNEPNVVDRLLKACTSFDFPNYEVIVVDDSTDETTSILKKWEKHPRVKLIHRDNRWGWKGGALNMGLDHTDPRSTHVLVLDADFIPPPDLLQRFLEKFNDDGVVVVQGYQKHTLNKDENWMTKGIRLSFSVYNLVELNAKGILGLPVPITGCVYMIRTELIKKLRYAEDITEDWNLTLRLYEEGYKVHYDPDLAAAGECPSTLRRFFRQQMRWAEGHTRNFRMHFWRIMRAKTLSLKEKSEFLTIGTTYLNSILTLILTLAWLLTLAFPSYAMSLPHVPLGIYLTLSCIPAAIFSAAVALTWEGSARECLRLPYMIFLYYIATPVVAYAALKGLFTNGGYFHRTYKTGRITDTSALNWKRDEVAT